MGSLCSYRDGHGQQKHPDRLQVLNEAKQVLSCPKCAYYISPHTNRHQPEPVIQSKMDSCFDFFWTKFCPYHLTVEAEIETQTNSCFPLVLFSLGLPVWSVAISVKV